MGGGLALSFLPLEIRVSVGEGRNDREGDLCSIPRGAFIACVSWDGVNVLNDTRSP